MPAVITVTNRRFVNRDRENKQYGSPKSCQFLCADSVCWSWRSAQVGVLAPAALTPVKTQYPLYRRLGGPQGQSRRVRKISPTPAFDPRTVQPIASRYTDWAIPAQWKIQTSNIFQHKRNNFKYFGLMNIRKYINLCHELWNLIYHISVKYMSLLKLFIPNTTK